MTSASYTYFIHYCLPLIINDLHIYAFTLFHAQPLLFFITASLLFIPHEIICFYFHISQYFIDITLDYLWCTLFNLYPNLNLFYQVHINNQYITFDFSFSPQSEEESEANDIRQLAQQDAIQLHRQHNQLYCAESMAQLFPSDTEMDDIATTSTDYNNIDEDINYDLDDYDCSTFPEDY